MAPNALQLQRSPYEKRILESQSELESLNKRISEERDILRKDAAEARKPRSISQADAFASGLLQLAPALIGYAISDTEGALAGLQGGATGGSQYLSAVRDRLSQEREADIADIDERRDALSELRGEKDDLDRSLDRLEIKDLDFEGRKQIAGMKEESANLTDEEREDILEAEKFGLNSLSDEKRLNLQKKAPKKYEALVREQNNLSARSAREEGREKYYEILEKQFDEKQNRRKIYVKTNDGKVLIFGSAPTEKEAKDAREFTRRYENRRMNLKEIQDIFEKSGDAFTGDDYQKLQSALGHLTLEIKGPEGYNLGAALTEPELKQLMTVLPKTFANSETLREVLLDRSLGREFLAKLDSLSDRTDREFKSFADFMQLDIPNSYDPLRNYNYRFEAKRDAPVEQEEVETKTLEDFGGDRRKHLEYLRSKYGR